MSFKHRHKASDVGESLQYALGNSSPDMQRQESASLLTPSSQSSATTVLRSRDLNSPKAPASPLNVSAVETFPEAVFNVRGTTVKARLNRLGLELTAVKAFLVSCIGRDVLGLVPFQDILAVETRPQRGFCATTSCICQGESLIIHTIKRSLQNPSLWRQRKLRLVSEDAVMVRDWAAKIDLALKSDPNRPSALLVIANPFGGAKKALKVWDSKAAPILDQAGVKVKLLSTEREGHAKEIIEELSLEDFKHYDGVIAVGGDGLFQEIMNGLLTVRSRKSGDSKAAQRWRVGHVPAGSTDAVAYSINGTRSVVTAVLHIALGDRMALDLMRVDTADGLHRFAVSLAGYGYMGDLMQASERLRWMGPPRYTTAGAVTLFRGQVYHAKIAYKPADSQRFSRENSRVVCRSHCNLCQALTAQPARDNHSFTIPATEALQEGEWKHVEGDYKGIMVVVTPCRSDRSTLGLLPYSHLNDGRLHIILIRSCSVLQYLRFLASIPQTGVQHGAFPYVDIIDATAVQITPEGKESRWSVDGELLANNTLAGQVHQGLLEVFARGVA